MPHAPLTLSRPLATQLLKQAQHSPQARVCGLVLGHADEAREIVPLRNTASDASQQHTFDTEEFRRACADAAERGLRLLAVYHSQPDQPPIPQPQDLAASPQADTPLLVISLNIKGVLEMRAFSSQGDQLIESPVTIFL